MRLALLGNPDNRRVSMFQEALARVGLPPAAVTPWALAVADPELAARRLAQADLVRLESPGESHEVEVGLIALGASVPDPGRAARIDAPTARALPHDHGRLRLVRQWFLGLRALLRHLAAHIQAPFMVPPSQIEVMFDKRLTQARLLDADLPIPPPLGPVEGYDALLGAMARAGTERAFVKLAHGSSASGVLAFSARPQRQYALCSVERSGPRHYHNSLKLRRYADPEVLRELIDFIGDEGAQAEVWLPKARQQGRPIDLRVVVIGGHASHVVVRQGRSPLTNLHLGNRRGDAQALRQEAGAAAWDGWMEVCQQAAAAFPGALYCGVDLLVTPDLVGCAVLEVNAFGDLLPGVTWEGKDTYQTQLEAALALYRGRP